MISPSTLDRVKGLVSSKKTWCYCKLSKEMVKLIGESGDRTDMVEMEGKRIRIKAGKQEEVIRCDGLCRCSCCARDAVA